MIGRVCRGPFAPGVFVIVFAAWALAAQSPPQPNRTPRPAAVFDPATAEQTIQLEPPAPIDLHGPNASSSPSTRRLS